MLGKWLGWRRVLMWYGMWMGLLEGGFLVALRGSLLQVVSRC